MMIGFAIFLFAIGIALCVASTKTDSASEIFLDGMFAGVCFVFVVIIIASELTYEEQTEFKYPVNEYKLEYEVLTKGEQADSTYVITKI